MKMQLTQTKMCGISLIGDCLLAAIKLIFGKLFGSSALFSDGIHSCADSVTSFFTLLGTLPKKDEKKKEVSEKITVAFICLVLFGTGSVMLITAAKKLILHTACQTPLPLAMLASLFSFFVKEALFFSLRYASKKLDSLILYAQAWHHHSDALSCIGSFIGTGGAVLGFPALDTVASIIISIMIMKSAVEIFREN